VIASNRVRWLVATVGLGAAVAWGSDQTVKSPVATGKSAATVVPKAPSSALLSGPHPLPCPTPTREAIESAIQRGVAFLLARQNRDGSWGSAHQTKGLDIYAPAPGAHQAFRAGVTALCVAALIEAAHDSGDVSTALDRGENWLLSNLPKLRRATPDAIYNNWGHAYGIHALSVMLQRRPGDKARAARIREAIRGQIDLLGRYECVDGGWCYYDFVAQTQQPSGSSISFVSATVLVSLKEAQRAGISVPERLVRRAVDSIHRQRKPDFSYCYGEYLKYRPMHPVNRPGGSLGRSQVCNLALRLWGDTSVTDEVLRVWLDRLFARNLWLDIGRKRPIPHESWFAVAGYFFYFGHYYAARCFEELPLGERSAYQDHLGQVLLHLQEKDGSWWDFPLYDYHQQYGTAFALMSLSRCTK
jgi:hypothetical protein